MVGLTILIGFLMLLVAVVVFFGITIVYGAPWFPTSTSTVRKMLTMADVHPGDVLYDLGCGDGRIIIMAAREFHAMSIGIDINPFWVFWIRVKIALFQLRGNVQVVRGNFFDQDLSNANIVTLYLLQETNEKLQPKLEKELQPGTRIISHVFTFTEWEPYKVDEDAHIYLYRIPEQPDHPTHSN
jgi:predicted RNA methylase